MIEREREELALSWTAYRVRVLEALEMIERDVREMNEKMSRLRTEIALLKFKTGMIATLVSSAVSVLGAVAYALLHNR
jgi:hypothetical protein